MSKQTQISLDFGPEEQLPASAGDNGTGSDPSSHYMAAGGVGVRVKSYKQTPAPGGGDLFGETAAAPEQATPETSAMSGATIPMAGTPYTNGLPEVASSAAEPLAEQNLVEPNLVEPNPIEPSLVEKPVTVASLAEGPVVHGQPGKEHVKDDSLERPATLGPVAMGPEAIGPEAMGPEAEEPSLPKRQISAKTTGTRQKSLPPQQPSKRGRKSLKQVSAEADLIEIPVDEVLFSKQYYTMGEVSEMFRVNQSLLRFWESEFDVLQPRKNKKGDRYFRPVDIQNLHLIYHLLRQKKYTIEGAKEFLKKNKKADERFEVIKRLQEIKTFLLEMKAQL